MSARAVVNLHPQHQFKALADIPEAQLLLLIPQRVWARALAYAPANEAATSAGSLGTQPGTYEWEVIQQPVGLKWHRRMADGRPFYYAAIVAPDPAADPIELCGIIDIAEDAPWWFDAIDNPAALVSQSENLSRKRNIPLAEMRLELAREEYRLRNLITAEPEGEPAWRLGTEEEVQSLRRAFVELVNRALRSET